MKIGYICMFAILLGAWPVTAPLFAAKKFVGVVDNKGYRYVDACGCSFYDPEKRPNAKDPETWKYVLLANAQGKGWMEIDGQVEELALEKDTVQLEGKKGDHFLQIYRGANISVRVEVTALGFGEGRSMFCDAIITVIKDQKKKQVIKAKGSCGC